MFHTLEKLLQKKWLVLLLITAFCLLAYCNSFLAPFTLDDFSSITDNQAIRNPLDLPALWKFYSNRIVLYFTLSLNYALHQDMVVGYHITNLVIHILNVFLFFLILRLLLQTEVVRKYCRVHFTNCVAFAGAILFAVHPVQVNAVTYVVQRTAALAGTFYLLAIFLYIHYRMHGGFYKFVLTIVSILFAMFTKENTITIPFMLILLECTLFLKDGKTSWHKRLLLILVLLLTVPVIPATNLFLQGYSQSDPGVSFKASTSMNRFHYFYTQMNVILKYIQILFVPVDMNFDYSNDFPLSKTIWEHNAYISLGIHACIGLLALICWKKNRLLSLGILWFYIGLSVESSFISIKDVYFEHRLYFPLGGYIIFLIGLWQFLLRLFKKRFLGTRFMLYSFYAVCIIIAAYLGTTLWRNYIFSDSIRLWSDVVSKAPKSDRAHSILGTNYLDAYELGDTKNQKYLDRAEEEMKKAIELNYYNDTSHCNLSRVYLLKKQYDKAILEGRVALGMEKSVYVYHNIGIAYYEQGKYTEALRSLQDGYALNKEKGFILKGLGNVYFALKDYENAVTYYEKYLKKYTNKDISDKLKKAKELLKSQASYDSWLFFSKNFFTSRDRNESTLSMHLPQLVHALDGFRSHMSHSPQLLHSLS